MKSISKILLSMLFLFGFAAGITATAAPGDKVSGVVKDAKGSPVVGAVIVILISLQGRLERAVLLVFCANCVYNSANCAEY